MTLRMISDRRSFFGKVFGGILAVLGLSALAEPITVGTVSARADFPTSGFSSVKCFRSSEDNVEFMKGYATTVQIARFRSDGWKVTVLDGDAG